LAVVDLFSRSWAALCAAVEGLEGGQWARPSGCTGWLVQDLVFHLVIDAQDVLITLVTPTDAEPNMDAVTYWQPAELPTGVDAETAFVRRGAAAYRDPDGLRHHFDDLAGAAGRAAAAADPAQRVETCDRVITVADYLGVYVVEWTLHHLDLVAHLPEVAGPPAEALTYSRQVLVKFAGATISDQLDDTDALRVVTGRRAPTEAETAALGDLAARLPLVLG
jgi:uncharacterized protein (TIGR03083 family)